MNANKVTRFHEEHHLLGRLELAQDKKDDVVIWRTVLQEAVVYLDVSCEALADHFEAARSTPRH